MREYYQGLFPMDNMSDLRFAINYYTTIGLGQLTEEMREVLALHEEIIN
jgi:pre-mRNA-splicing factor CWC22